MKIREGFVSNSSSSSFVLKGYLVDNFDPEKAVGFIRENYPDLYTRAVDATDGSAEEILYEWNNFIHTPIIFKQNDEDYGIPEGECFIGKLLQRSSSDDGGLDNMIVDFQPSNDLALVKESLGIESEIKVLVGTYWS